MSITFGELKTRVSVALQDPDERTFTDALVEELIQSALVEVGRIAPEQYSEDLTPILNQITYQLRYSPVDVDVTGAAATDLLTSTGHSLQAGERIRFTELTGGTGLSINTTYWVISSGLTANDFKVSLTLGGSAVNFTTDVTAGAWLRLGTVDAIPEIELTRVEVWDPTTNPDTFVMKVPQGALQPEAGQDAGWVVWGGILYLPTRIVQSLDEYIGEYVIRVWGYSPYLKPDAEADIIAVSSEVQQAMVWYIRVEAIDMLLASRDLFTQWQTRSGNTDISPAQLMNQRSIAEQMWTRRSRQLARLRSGV